MQPIPKLDPANPSLRRQKVAKLIEDTANAVILPRFRSLAKGDVREKKPGDLVTIADEESELMLAAGLTDLWPGSDILGEEGVARDAARLDLAHSMGAVWIIDPIDGTSNFVAGREYFAVIIGLAVGGIVTEGWIYQPMAGKMIYAQRGNGAWQLSGNDWHQSQILHYHHQPEISKLDAMTAVGAAYGRRSKPLDFPENAEFEPSVSAFLRQSGRVGNLSPQNSSGTEYISLALGELHWSLHSRSLPWDHAAGMLITSEAGGIARNLDGTEYDWRDTEQNPLASVNEPIFHQVRGAITS